MMVDTVDLKRKKKKKKENEMNMSTKNTYLSISFIYHDTVTE